MHLRFLRRLSFGLVWLLSFTVLTLPFCQAASAEENPLSASAKFSSSKIGPGGTTELVISLQLQENYHAYLERFKLAIESPDDLKLDQFHVSPIVQFMDSVSKNKKDGMENKAEMRTTVEVPKGFHLGTYTAKINLTYQACTSDHCLFPKHLLLEAPFEVISGREEDDAALAGAFKRDVVTSAPAVSSNVGSNTDGFTKALGHGTFSALAFVFFIGLLTSLTPCIYPMIPITLAVLGARTKGQSKIKSFSLSFTYVLGIAFTYSLLGVSAAKTGALFGSALSNVFVVTAIALVFVTMGLSMYGLFELQVPAFIRNRIGTAETGSGYGGAFLTGLIAGIVASPCVGPVLVSVLTYIAQTQDLVLGFLFLFTFAMGLGVLFIVLGTSSSLLGKLPKAGAWMELVKFVFGTVMVAMALYYIKPIYPNWLFNSLLGIAAISIASAYGAFESNVGLGRRGRLRKGAMLTLLVIGFSFAVLGVLEKTGAPFLNPKATEGSSDPGALGKLNWHPYSQAALDAALKEGRPVIIDFSADWCVSCKELEKFTFTDPRVRTLSENFTLFTMDATDESAMLDGLKKRYTVVGLPTMIFFDMTGAVRQDLTLTGFEDAGEFSKRMSKALEGSSPKTDPLRSTHK